MNANKQYPFENDALDARLRRRLTAETPPLRDLWPAVAARLNTSLTGIRTPLHILPGGDLDALDEALALPGTKVLMKSGRQMPAVLERLAAHGLLEHSGMVCNCGLPDEMVRPDLSKDAAPVDAGYFATIIVKEEE